MILTISKLLYKNLWSKVEKKYLFNIYFVYNQSKAALEHKILLVGGSIPEREGEKLYNSCCIFNEEGSMIGKYRKTHLFDIDIPGKITFRESDTLTQG